eukprot:COSAG05_NODE_12455_length_467_cov_1.127717_1_plen_54_part_10
MTVFCHTYRSVLYHIIYDVRMHAMNCLEISKLACCARTPGFPVDFSVPGPAGVC